MDDWSHLPSRNAVSEPAPNHQSPLSPTTKPPIPMPGSTRRVKRHHRRRAPLPAGRALDPPGRARQLSNEVRGRAPKPLLQPRIPMITTPIPHTNVKNGQPPLDNTRPFMDDTGRLISCPGRANRSKSPISAHNPAAVSVSTPRRQRSRSTCCAHGELGSRPMISRSSCSRRWVSASIAPCRSRSVDCAAGHSSSTVASHRRCASVHARPSSNRIP